MFDNGATAAMGGLVATDLTVADHAELADAARAVARVQAFVDLAKVQIARRTLELLTAPRPPQESPGGVVPLEHICVERGDIAMPCVVGKPSQ